MSAPALEVHQGVAVFSCLQLRHARRRLAPPVCPGHVRYGRLQASAASDTYLRIMGASSRAVSPRLLPCLCPPRRSYGPAARPAAGAKLREKRRGGRRQGRPRESVPPQRDEPRGSSRFSRATCRADGPALLARPRKGVCRCLPRERVCRLGGDRAAGLVLLFPCYPSCRWAQLVVRPRKCVLVCQRESRSGGRGEKGRVWRRQRSRRWVPPALVVLLPILLRSRLPPPHPSPGAGNRTCGWRARRRRLVPYVLGLKPGPPSAGCSFFFRCRSRWGTVARQPGADVGRGCLCRCSRL